MIKSDETKKIMEKINKKLKVGKVLTIFLAFTLVVVSAVVPSLGKAATFAGIEDTVSDSDPNASAQSVTHTIVATTTQMMGVNSYFEIVFPAGFTDISSGNLTCPSAGSAGGSGNTLTCTYAGGLSIAAYSFTITGTTNPSSAGSYLINMVSKTSGAVEIESGTTRIAIVDDVEVSATVESSLTFTINGVGTTTAINGVSTTGSSTNEELAFGILTPGSTYTLGQRLNVSTNAGSGFTVTVAQDGNLQTGGGADIDSFVDGVAASTTPVVWAAPSGTLGSEDTYGHFGITAQDGSLSDGDPFGASLYKGFYGTDPVEVMYHDGPSDGATIDIGSSTVAYTLEINALQETGDYTSNLTYVCTPKY